MMVNLGTMAREYRSKQADKEISGESTFADPWPNPPIWG
jgi:hypothetical protein